MGDYSGIASYNDRVYGAWAEETAEPRKQPDRKVKDESAEAARSHTVVRVGVADFRQGQGTGQ